jgi:hypothetical protein
MTSVVTYDTGGTGRPAPAVTVLPERHLPLDVVPPGLVETGLDAAFVGDLLSACLAHVRCGTNLYRSVAARTIDDTLRAQYVRFGDETHQHVETLEAVIAAAGGDPFYVSASARAAEQAATALLESTFMLAGSLDAMTAETVMLEVVVLAEVKAAGNARVLAQLAAAMAPGVVQAQMADATQQLLADEEAHRTWADDTRTRLLVALAGAVPAAGTGVDRDDADLDGLTRDELYARAQELDIAGRSQMDKAELREAIVMQDPPTS